MKKIFILIIGVLIIWNVGYSQSPTLNFRINNPRIEQINFGGVKSFLCFDVQVSATASGTYFDGIQTAFSFNTSGLIASGTLNRQVLKGTLANGDFGGTPFYDLSVNWVSATNRLFVGVFSNSAWAGAPADPLYMNEITTSYQTLVVVKIQITDKSLIANLTYVQGSMNGVSTYRDNDGFAVYYNSPYNYHSHDLASTYLGRIHSAAHGWSQTGNTVVGTGWTDWTVAENTTVWDGNGHITNVNSLANALYVDPTGIITIDPGKSLSASGVSHFEDSHSIVILADATGVGSFIDNGTITYGTNGSADVQTWINNTAGGTNFHFHQVGPTVMDPSYSGPGTTGVFLGAFNLPENTYTYLYDELTGNWQNIYPTNTPVPTATGLMLSTANNTAHTMTMTGQLLTGTVTTATSMGHSGNNLELISNPYPSAVDFDVLYTLNNTNISNTMYIWVHGAPPDPPPANQAGNYGAYVVSSGGTNGVTQDIQVGQGFFVETLNSVPFIFDNTARLHSTAPFFKNSYIDHLLLRAAGNEFSDEAIIHFYEDASSHYIQNEDAYKWSSAFPEATEMWTVANDQSNLSINALPSLDSRLVSVPLAFKCGAENSYSITAEGIDSFEPGTAIYLEDLLTGAPWHSFIYNSVYEFTATPEDPVNRFIVHFFGPTGINDPDALRAIKIYGYGQDAYIVNRGNETVKEYVAYDMMGRELHRGTLPNSTVNKVTIGNVNAYYIVKVITKEGKIYTDKVYISQ